MSSALQQLFAFLGQHATALEEIGGIVGIAFITTLPAQRPRSLDEIYDYFRDALQTAIPAGKRASNPIVPAEPAQK